jgi:hypothetical protein
MRPHFDLQTRATAYFLRYHLQELSDAPNIAGGLFECVSAWKYSGRTCPQVDLALSCLALAVYSRTQLHPTAALAASSKYYTALQISQTQLAKMEKMTITEGYIDACLLSSFLMGRYEGTVQYLRPDSPETFLEIRNWSHYDGLMAILKVWRDRMSQCPPSTIVKYTRRQVLKFLLLRSLLLPDWILDGGLFGECGLELDYDRILIQVINLRHNSIQLLSEQHYALSKAAAFYDEATQLERTMEAWITRIPGHCQKHHLSKPSRWPLRHFYSLTVNTYTSIGHSAVWVGYFATRMLLSSVKLRLLERCADSSAYMKQRIECTEILNEMGNDMASSIPFCLERISLVGRDPVIIIPSTSSERNEQIKPYLASAVIWPLALGSSIDCINTRHKQWFKSELATIGTIIGDGLLEHAGSDKWVEL